MLLGGTAWGCQCQMPIMRLVRGWWRQWRGVGQLVRRRRCCGHGLKLIDEWLRLAARDIPSRLTFVPWIPWIPSCLMILMESVPGKKDCQTFSGFSMFPACFSNQHDVSFYGEKQVSCPENNRTMVLYRGIDRYRQPSPVSIFQHNWNIDLLPISNRSDYCAHPMNPVAS